MFAVISDVHSNLEALTTVLADIESRGIKKIYCLGDVVGYGPNPKECLDLIIEKTEWCVLGNHDYAVFYEPTNFNYGAEQASFWTRDILGGEKKSDSRNLWWRFLGELPMRRTLEAELGDVPLRYLGEIQLVDRSGQVTGRRVAGQETQDVLTLQVREGYQGLRVVTQQVDPQAIMFLHYLLGQVINPTQQAAHLLNQNTIGFSRNQSMLVSSDDVCQ